MLRYLNYDLARMRMAEFEPESARARFARLARRPRAATRK